MSVFNTITNVGQTIGREDAVTQASGDSDSGGAGTMPARWWLGIVLAMVALRILWEMAD